MRRSGSARPSTWMFWQTASASPPSTVSKNVRCPCRLLLQLALPVASPDSGARPLLALLAALSAFPLPRTRLVRTHGARLPPLPGFFLASRRSRQSRLPRRPSLFLPQRKRRLRRPHRLERPRPLPAVALSSPLLRLGPSLRSRSALASDRKLDRRQSPGKLARLAPLPHLVADRKLDPRPRHV